MLHAVLPMELVGVARPQQVENIHLVPIFKKRGLWFYSQASGLTEVRENERRNAGNRLRCRGQEMLPCDAIIS